MRGRVSLDPRKSFSALAVHILRQHRDLPGVDAALAAYAWENRVSPRQKLIMRRLRRRNKSHRRLTAPASPIEPRMVTPELMQMAGVGA